MRRVLARRTHPTARPYWHWSSKADGTKTVCGPCQHLPSAISNVTAVVQLPAGTVTFLFTDIEGSTRLWESATDSMRLALERHDAIFRSAIEDNGGYVFATGGDGFAVAFNRVGQALATAAAAQAMLGAESWPEGVALRVRMAVHTGEASEREGDYFGPAVNLTARLTATAHGGQVVCSASTASLADSAVPLRSLGEHRLRDLAAAQQVFQVGEGTFPPLRSVDVVPTNLPTMRTEMIGRTEEIANLIALLEHERLLTLTGVGGVGKTRLALGVAAAVAPGYADGCWLVDLAPVAEGAEVPKALAAAVGAPVGDDQGLIDYMSERHMLLILDNCEHVIGDVADLIDAALVETGEIDVLATSREPLGLDGEVVRRVSSLSVPKPESSVDDALATASVRLFVERAVAVTETFALDDVTVGPVIDICRHLDGIPLAIELAAARVRSMPPSEVAGRLDERFRLLGGGSRRAQERHRTLLATVSWSHDLLSVAERTVFRRLAVFPASFTLDGAEAVVGHGDVDTDVVGSVLGLVDKSLVQFDPVEGRYRLLETLRQFAADRLGDSGETPATRERHARFYLDLVEHQAARFLGEDYISASVIVVPETENLRSAALWCIDEARFEELAALCRRALYFAIQSAPVDGITWRQQVLAHRDLLETRVIVEILGELAYLEVVGLGDYEGAAAHAEESVAFADDARVAHSAWGWAARSHVQVMTGRYEETVSNGERTLQLADAAEDTGTASIALCDIAAALAGLGRREESMIAAAEALRRAEECHHPVYVGAAVITSSASYLTQVETPDFNASLGVLAQRPEALDVGGTNNMWLDTFWGWTLMGLSESRALDHLVRAARTADQMNARHLSDLILRLLAIYFAAAGYVREAASLVRYVEANLRPYRIAAPGQAWVNTQIEEMGIAATSSDPSTGRRSDIMALVSRTAFSITQSERPD
jgi:predicted ATPase/class 3 adenylate cyclase